MRARLNRKHEPEHPNVSFSEHAGVRHLHLGSEWVQGSMRVSQPLKLELEYIQRMMAGLLFMPGVGVSADVGAGADKVTITAAHQWAERRSLQLGLGAGALSKCCAMTLGMPSTAIEINPQVLNACRSWFALPHEHPRLEVLLADAGAEIQQPRWQAAVDVLHVDMYDQEAAAPVFDSEAFYADCRATLTAQGSMAVNLFGRQASYANSLAKIVAVFGAACVWAFPPTREGNSVVIALRQAHPGFSAHRAHAAAQAEAIETAYKLPAKKWLLALQPAPAAQTCTA
jgi:spermidine synthase